MSHVPPTDPHYPSSNPIHHTDGDADTYVDGHAHGNTDTRTDYLAWLPHHTDRRPLPNTAGRALAPPSPLGTPSRRLDVAGAYCAGAVGGQHPLYPPFSR